MFNRFILWLKDLSQIRLFIALVLYAAGAAIFFQSIVLPYIIPELHAGNGLLINGDWVNFHKIAFRKYEEIIAHGWQVWELRPRGQFPSGVASIFYVLIHPEPWSLVPVNAVVWAASGIVVIRIVEIFTNNRGYATLACVPFLFLPSAAMWYTQILKDGFYTLGLLLLLYSCIRAVKFLWIEVRLKNIIYNFVIILMSITLVWAVRPYGVHFTLALISFIAVLATVYLLKTLVTHKNIPVTAYVNLTSIILAVIFTSNISSLSESNSRISLYNEVIYKPSSYNKKYGSDSFRKSDAEAYIQNNWTKSESMPGFLERKLLVLSVIRAKYININPEAGSNIKGDEHLFSGNAVMRFIPRAIQIVYTEPSPIDWFRRLSDGSASFFYKISMFEMIIVYLGLFFFLIALWLWRTRWEIWLITAFTGMYLLVHGIVIPNIGTLYRMRYGMLMLLVTIGLAELMKIIHDRNQPSNPL